MREIEKEYFLTLGRTMIKISQRPDDKFVVGKDIFIIGKWTKNGREIYSICENVGDIQTIFGQAETITAWYKTRKDSPEMARILMPRDSSLKPVKQQITA